jgi:DNA-binding HxlR family transcriptional regulator
MTESKRLDQPERPSRFAYAGLDRVIHEKARLSLLTSLVTHPNGLRFGDLKQLCALTDGNLNRHLQVLESAELIRVFKHTAEQRPHTVCQITELGRKRYLEYLSVLEQVILDASSAGVSRADLAGLSPALDT